MKKLSRESLRNLKGGQACSLAIQGSDGTWVTRHGECVTNTIENSAGITIAVERYCETGLGNVPLSSNGGQTRCS